MLTQIFMYEGAQVRTVMIDGEPHWVAKDVCDILEIDTSQIRRLDEDEKAMYSIQTLGGKQEMVVVNESGLYSLVLGSKKPEAKPFKRWITHEVLPQIRKTGTYSVKPQLPQNYKEALLALVGQVEKTELLEAQLEATKPLTAFAESLQVATNSILIGELAKLLKQNGINIGRDRLFETLRRDGYLMSHGTQYNAPTQRSMDLKLMEIKVGIRASIAEGTKTTQTTKITGKGIMYFINKFKDIPVSA